MGKHRGGDPEIEVRTPEGHSCVLFGPLARLAGLVDCSRTVVLTDPVIRERLPREFPTDHIVDVPCGEAAKSLVCAESVYERFMELGAGRDWTVLGVGGGSVSDLAGFAASVWLRGADFGIAPTTILSMVDASVGRRNGVNCRGARNLMGTFRQPRFVLVDVNVLASLPASEMAEGLVASIRYAIIEGDEHFRLLERAIPRRKSGEPYRPPENPRDLEEVVRRSIELRARIVSEDAREEGARRSLNLGQTIGRAVEAATSLPPGACAAVGLACSLRLAARRGGSERDAERVLDLLYRLGMPCSLGEARAAADIQPDVFRTSVVRALSLDKRRIGKRLLVALPRALGSVDIESMELAEIEQFVREAS